MAISAKQTKLDKANKDILLCAFCNSNAKGMLVPGEGKASSIIVFVGEAPGKQEVETGRPFIGRAGKVLRMLIGKARLNDGDVFITSAVKYLPKTYITPKPSDIEHGRTHLFNQLGIIKPKFVVLLGNVAAIAVLGEKHPIAKVHGTFLTKEGIDYFLSYHPAAPLYDPKLRETLIKDFAKLKRRLKK